MEPDTHPGFQQHFERLPFENLGVDPIVATGTDRLDRPQGFQAIADLVDDAACLGDAPVADAQDGDDVRAGDHPAQVAVPLDQQCPCALPGCCQGCSDPCRATACHHHVHIACDRRAPRRLLNRLCHAESSRVVSR